MTRQCPSFPRSSAPPSGRSAAGSQADSTRRARRLRGLSAPLTQPGADPLLLTRFAAALGDWSRAPDRSAEDCLLGTISDRLRTQWSLLYPGDPIAPLRDLSRSLGASSRLVLSEAKGEALLLVLRLTGDGDWRPAACLRFRSQAGKIASIQLASL